MAMQDNWLDEGDSVRQNTNGTERSMSNRDSLNRSYQRRRLQGSKVKKELDQSYKNRLETSYGK